MVSRRLIGDLKSGGTPMNCTRPSQRSLTLLETLIALVLLVALGALIVPSLVDSLEERSFESAADVTNEQLLLARAHAQATGTPVEVTYSAGQSTVTARPFLPWLPGFQPMGNASTGTDAADHATNSFSLAD